MVTTSTLQSPLTLEEFMASNAVELNCIFAETGRTLELDFEPEAEALHYYERPEVYQLQYSGLIYMKAFEDKEPNPL